MHRVEILPAVAFADLSRREHEILAGITEGLTNVPVAGRLNVTEKAVRDHIPHLFSKLGAQSRAHAIVPVRDLGLDA